MARLDDLYKTEIGRGIPKLQLAERLVDGMLAKGVRRTDREPSDRENVGAELLLWLRATILLRCSMYGNTIKPQSISARRDAKGRSLKQTVFSSPSAIT